MRLVEASIASAWALSVGIHQRSESQIGEETRRGYEMQGRRIKLTEIKVPFAILYSLTGMYEVTIPLLK